MPKSTVRKKTVYTPPTDVKPVVRKHKASPRFVPVLAVVLLVVGIAWLVVYYLSSGQYPITPLKVGNLAVGFACLIAALGVLTQWR